MLSETDFLNRFTSDRLNAYTKSPVAIGFGMDANKVKGVNDFPIYNRGVGFESRAPPSVAPLLFNDSNRYDIPFARSSRGPPAIADWRWVQEGRDLGPPAHTNMQVPTRVMSTFYGLPPDKTIKLENPAAEAMGLSQSKTPAADFMVSNWQKDAVAQNAGLGSRQALDAFMLDPAVQAMLTRGTPLADAVVATKARKVLGTHAPRPRPAPPAAGAPRRAVVGPVFNTAAPPSLPEGTGAADLPTATATASSVGVGKKGGDSDDEGDDDTEEVEPKKRGGDAANINWDFIERSGNELWDRLLSLSVANVKDLNEEDKLGYKRLSAECLEDVRKLARKAELKVPKQESITTMVPRFVILQKEIADAKTVAEAKRG